MTPLEFGIITFLLIVIAFSSTVNVFVTMWGIYVGQRRNSLAAKVKSQEPVVEPPVGSDLESQLQQIRDTKFSVPMKPVPRRRV